MLVLVRSPSPRIGELSFLCFIDMMAACKASRFSRSMSISMVRPLVWGSSSSLELWDESGGEMVMPAGINELLTGGGDERMLPWGSKVTAS